MFKKKNALIALLVITALLLMITPAIANQEPYGIGLYSQASGTFYIKNDSTPGPADSTFRYGPWANDWLPVAGDWDGSGYYGVALYDQAGGRFFCEGRQHSRFC